MIDEPQLLLNARAVMWKQTQVLVSPLGQAVGVEDNDGS